MSKRHPGRRLVARWHAEGQQASPLDPGAYVVQQFEAWYKAQRTKNNERAARRRACNRSLI